MKKLTIIIAALLLCSTPVLAATDGGKATMSLGYNYSQGDYGQASDTKVHYVPATVKYKWGEWTAKLIVPWIQITGPGVVVGDVPVGAPRPVGTESGLGDVNVSLAWTHVLNTKGTTLEITGISKIPTADEDKRLGTGLWDETLQAGLIQPLGNWFVMGNVGYKWNGDNASFPLDNVWKGTVGGGYRFNAATSAGVIYDYREKQSAMGDPLNLATAFVSHDFGEGFSAQLYGSAGFSNASPDGAIGIQFNKEFDLF
ncbi:MAG: hypothetical protein ACAH80_14435 [Alphaproteobacteria bacterium]